LLRIAYHFVGDWDDAEDVAQTTLLRVFSSLHRYDSARPFSNWLLGIHLNNCKSYYRRRRLERIIRVPLDALTAPPSVDPDNQDGVLAIIQRQIEKLTWKQQAAFVLMEIEERNSQEAADLMNCSPATARVHLSRAKSNLKQSLQRLGINRD
jgi:RNA polymerase sigma factor (sigma-70 family)